MASLDVGGTKLFYEQHGAAGPPMVLAHGSWVDHTDWAAVAPDLGRDFRVVAYDRRGHSRSARPPGQGSVDEDAADLAALIEHLGLGPAHVVGNSFGAVIALRLAARRPDLVRSLNIHEPPLFGLLAATPEARGVAEAAQVAVGKVIALLSRGEMAAAAERFVDDVALGPGAWAGLPEAFREVLVNNAPTFLDETREPGALALDPTALQRFDRPLLLTQGTESPPAFALAAEALGRALPHARRHTFAGAGHLPHQTHPAGFTAQARALAT